MLLSLERKMLTLGHRHTLAPASPDFRVIMRNVIKSQIFVVYLSSTRSHTATS